MKKGVDYPGVGVGVMIFDHHGRLLLMRRGPEVRNERGCWDLPGGGVRWRENRADAIRREALEELGVTINIVRELLTIDHMPEGQHWVTTTYVASIQGGRQPRIMEPRKCDGLDWFLLSKLPSPLALSTQRILPIYRESRARR